MHKIALFTDIHFGAKSNSRIHNQDNIDYVNWFIDNIKNDKTIDSIGFLGDWFESRSAINVETLEFSYRALKLLNILNLPIYFIVGNHDLYRRNTRDIHSVNQFNEFSNITVIDKPTVIDEKFLFSPFLFHEEYSSLIKYNNLSVWFGHFEFSNFYITGYNTLMIGGPDHKNFSGPNKIFSGHFHKRQSNDNVVYIGNVFPTNFGDAGDYERGMCTYEINNDKVEFINWLDAPKYYKISLSKLYKQIESGDIELLPKMKVKCIVDLDIKYSDIQAIKEDMIKTFDLRDFIFEEDKSVSQELLEDGSQQTNIDDNLSIDELVVNQLESLKGCDIKINSDILVSIYKDLPLDLADNE